MEKGKEGKHRKKRGKKKEKRWIMEGKRGKGEK